MRNATELAVALRPYVEGRRNRLFSEIENLLGEILDFLERQPVDENQYNFEEFDTDWEETSYRHERYWKEAISRHGLDKTTTQQFQLLED